MFTITLAPIGEHAMRTAFTIVVVTLLLALSLPAHAMFVRPDIEKVPIDRVITNLEAQAAALLKTKPKESDQITAGEHVRLQVLEDESLNGRYLVQADGTIRLPKDFGAVTVGGKKIVDAENAVRAVLQKKLRQVSMLFEQEPDDRGKRLEPGETTQRIYALARIHSMAYAGQVESWDMLKNGGQPYFFPFSDGFGWVTVSKPKDEEKRKEAEQHLKRAIELYRVALDIYPHHLPSLLGVAWCLDQSGDKNAAREAYRVALKKAWATESTAKRLYEGASFTDEIAGYLLKLLDPAKDADEIATIKGYTFEIAKKPRFITPILIPLEDARFEDLVNSQAHVAFDLDGSGYQREWGWITPKAGWLVYDHDGKGKITSGLQLFGSVTFWIFWSDGYQALSSLDDDGNVWLEGAELEHLAIWQDANSNGISEPGEVRPLSELGITGIACRNQTPNGPLPSHPQGVRLKDGSFRPSYDWVAPGHPASAPARLVTP